MPASTWMRAGGADLQPGTAGQFHVGPHADAEDDQVGGQPPLAGQNARDLPFPLERSHLGVGHDLDPVRLHVPFNQPRHFPIQHAQNLG